MRVASLPDFKGWQLEAEILDPGELPLLRGFQRTGGEWQPPPPEFRNSRVDPPPGYKSEYAVLYTATEIQCVAAETRILRDDREGVVWLPEVAQAFRIATFRLGRAGLFIPLDGRNRKVFKLRGECGSDHQAYQWLALELHRRYGHLAHGLSWESFHRNQPGRCYGIWHSRKDDLALGVEDERPRFSEDPRWAAFLSAHPFIAARPRESGFGVPLALENSAIS